jgi:peptidoglycan/xylan/chitin deacetylase (PgdA/CDA1 family)
MPIWNVRLYDFLNSAPLSLLSNLRLPGFNRRLESGDWESKRRYGLALSKFLKARPREERLPFLGVIEESMSRSHDVSSTRMMSVEDIKSVSQNHEVGVHSYSHESMGFESDEFFAQDYERCRAFFQQKLELPLSIYAFPNGSYRREQIEFLKERGCAHVLLVGEMFSTGNSGIYPRFTMSGETFLEARFQALGLKAGGVL